ncbi:acyltransferase family protein [Puniceicoccales bacterium CK1056]|uniref:Acyltransferase family protein n=1 Tax=Oceanipulchritudo coccoides TaxID=2706888 RepID=A0A6B2M2G6_9BACT|nr:acyltransferase family protein [Oceanipulchritudo coccoides]NDV62324.1 acyltransferase family protein [Oceanipulchritudo coccoides]
MRDRVAYIDNLRIMVNFLIVLNHSFWNKSLETTLSTSELELVELLRFFSMNLGPIRVPFFFLIAGLFSATYLGKRGIAGFSKTRFERILIPLIIALCSYVYLVLVISRFGDLSRVLNVEDYSNYIVSGFGGLGYVWFLYVLIIYSGVLLGFYWIAQKVAFLKSGLRKASDLFCYSKYTFLGALLFIETCKFVFLHTVPDELYENVPFLPLKYLVHNITYFSVGALAGLSFKRFQNNIRFNLYETIVFILIYALTGYTGYAYGLQPVIQLYSVISNALPLVLMLSIFNVYLNKRVTRLNFVTNSTYTIYLIHFPVISLLTYLLIQLQITALTVYFTVILLSYPLSLVTALIIRRFKLTAFLFGAKPLYSFRRSIA